MSITLLGCKDPYNFEINHITGEYNPLHKIFKQCLITCIYSQADWLDRKLPCKFMHWCLPCPWILISELNRHILQTLPAATRREQRHLPLVQFWARKSNKWIWTKLISGNRHTFQKYEQVKSDHLLRNRHIHPWKLTWHWKTPFSIGNPSFNMSDFTSY